MSSVIGHIGDFFKNLGHHIKTAFIALFGADAGQALASAAEEWLKTELGKVAITVVQGLEAASGMSGVDKQAQAFKQIGTQLEAQGQNIPASLINFAIEFALQILRGATPKA